MKLSKINTINTTYLYYNQHNNNKKIQNISFLGKDFEYKSSPIDFIKKETDISYKDSEYRKNLMLNAGLNPKHQYKIRSIIGPNEITSIIKDFNDKPEVFSVGENDINIKKGIIRANLHMHTLNSDGSLTVQKLLDDAANYADKVVKKNPDAIKEPFIVAITDHDTLEGTNQAIKIISKNPEKYKNLRVILGAEITTFNNVGLDYVKDPTNTHVLVYGIDPNEKTFKNFIDNTKEKKLNLQHMMTKSANKIYKEQYGVDDFYKVHEAKKQYSTVRKNIVGIFNGMERYFQTKFVVENIIMKNDKMKSELEKHKIPLKTEDFMEQMSNYRKPIDNNNKVLPVTESLPDYISAHTNMKKEEVKDIIESELKEGTINKFNKDLKSTLSEYKVTLTPKYDYMPTFKTIYDSLKNQKNAIIGIAHPIDIVKNINNESDKYGFLEDLFLHFKTNCKEKAKFTEAYYQSYKTERKEFNISPKTQKFFNKVNKVYKLFKTGSHDTHGLNIFRR